MQILDHAKDRFSGYIDFKLSDGKITDFILTADKVRVFFQYGGNQTLKDLSDQHKQITGKPIIFQSAYASLHLNMPIKELTQTSNSRKILQSIINKIEKNEDITDLKCFDISKPEQKQTFTIFKKHIKQLEPSLPIFQCYECKIIVMNIKDKNIQSNLKLNTIIYKIGETTTFLDIIRYVNNIIGQTVCPFQIRSEGGFSIKEKIYCEAVNKTGLKIKQYIFDYPFVVPYECQLFIDLNQEKPLQFKYVIRNQTSINDIIDFIVVKTNFNTKNFRITDADDKILVPSIKDYNKSLIQMGVFKNSIRFKINSENCYFRSNTLLFIRQKQQIKIKEIKNVRMTKQQIVVGYNIQKNEQQTQQISNFIQIKNIYQYYQVKFTKELNQHEEDMLQIQYLEESEQRQQQESSQSSQQIRQEQGKSQLEIFQLRQKRKMQKKKKKKGKSKNGQSKKRNQRTKTKLKWQMLKETENQRQVQKIKLQQKQYENRSERNRKKQEKRNEKDRKKEEKRRQQTIKKQQFREFMQQTILLQCSGDVLILKAGDNTEWVSVRQLKIEQTVSGFDRELKPTLFKIKQICQVKTDKPESFYSFEVSPSHNFSANQIICHNKDSIMIDAYTVNGNSISKKSIPVYRDSKLGDIFGNKTCQIGDLTLNNKLTFGDYQLQNFKCLFILQNINSSLSQCIVSQWRSNSKQFSNWGSSDKNKWQKQYLGLYGGKIVQVSQSLNSFNGSPKTNLLVAPKTNLLKLDFQNNIRSKYISYENKINAQYSHISVPPQIVQNASNFMNQKQVFPIYLYTRNQIYYHLNTYLRQREQNNPLKQKWLTFTTTISNSLKKLPNYRGTTYRGMSNIKIQYAFLLNKKSTQQNESYTIFSGFTSTSKNIATAQGFCSNGVVLTLKLLKGKEIQRFSAYTVQDEVLIQAFTYFAINTYNIHSNPQTMELQQIPMPETTNQKLVFWVDDQPEGNRGLIQSMIAKNIQVVEIISTRIMRIILRQFFWIFKMMGKKIVILSDMARFEDGAWNSLAGVDLFEIIYNKFGLSNKAIIYTGNKVVGEQKVKSRGITSNQWFVTDNGQQVLRQVDKEFQRM